jgi:hypothetical protein
MPVSGLDLKGFNAEAVVVYPGADPDRVHLLSDDGNRETGGVACRELNDPARRSFRSAWVTVTTGEPPPR